MAARKPETRARKLALQLLYGWDVTDPAAGEVGGAGREAAWGRVLACAGAGPRVEERALVLAGAAVARAAAIDACIVRAADRWRLDRLGVIDRNVLRLAVAELEEGATPPKVVIDEAVRLARWFGGDKSPAFVNGVLDRIARDLGRL